MLPPRPLNCIWNKPNLFANPSLCSDTFQYAKKICESLINSIFFTSRVNPDILINVHKDCTLTKIYFGKPELCLIFILSENKDFHSGVLLKMPPSSPSMEEFDLDIQK